MIDNPHKLAAALMELAETNRPSTCSWVSARLREISDNLVEPAGDPDDYLYPEYCQSGSTYYLSDEGEAILWCLW